MVIIPEEANHGRADVVSLEHRTAAILIPQLSYGQRNDSSRHLRLGDL